LQLDRNRRLRAARNLGIYPRMETICYCAAVRTAARRTTALYDAILEPAGVTLAQFSLLRKIKRAGTVSLTGLGRLAELDRSTIGRNVKALEKLRLVSMASAEDHREAAVRLTPAGERVLRAGAPLWDEAQRRVEAALGAAGAAQLHSLAYNL
jgi:DNA-binding MarR family transcriptional regulator